MKNIVLQIIAGLFCLNLTASDKEPVAMDDFAQASVYETISIKVLENDFTYENHPFKIQIVLGSPNGITTFNDSTVFYTPKSFATGVDSLRYRIIDLENNLLSPFAKIYIQIVNKGIKFLDANQVKCKLIAGGMQFFDGEYFNSYEVPAGTSLYTIFSKSFWIGGYDQSGELHVAGERYKITGTDFYPGPISDTISYDENYDIQWFKVWKLNKNEIAFHRENWDQSGYEPIESISSWPGNGNPELGQNPQSAPYYDWDNDDIYNPYNGDFPLIKGDQAILIICNDDRVHGESKGKKLGVEVHAMYYVYDQPDDTALSQTIFGTYQVINRSTNDYSDVYTAFFLDFDIGSPWDDYIGCDTLIQSAFAFNGYSTDGDGGSGTYGNHPPAQSFTCLNYEMSGFMFSNNAWASPMTDPQNDVEYYNYMKSVWRDGSPLTYGGNGYGGNIPVKYSYSGDPVANDGWTEELAGNLPGDRRGLISKRIWINSYRNRFINHVLNIQGILVKIPDFV
ncbi:MAG: hypothetical protein EOM06_07440, partial [Sphingobacteriia bacterium]|nr:hypothetical protein [Sphingobacteriia bacterium]